MYNAQQTLTCNPNSESDLAGYRFYAGTVTRVYDGSFTTSSTSPSASIAGLLNGTTYYFSSTAFDSAGNESTFSSEISKTITVPVLQLVRQLK